jgi:hypothetical protein
VSPEPYTFDASSALAAGSRVVDVVVDVVVGVVAGVVVDVGVAAAAAGASSGMIERLPSLTGPSNATHPRESRRGGRRFIARIDVDSAA